MHEDKHQGSIADEQIAAEAAPRGGGDVLSLIADVERHLDRIRNVQNRQESEFADLAERQRRVAATESSLEERRAELDAMAARIGEAQAANEEARAKVARDQEAFEERRTVFESEIEALTTTRTELDDLRASLEARAGELDRQAATIAENDAVVREQMDALAVRETALVARVEAADAARGEAESALVAATESLAARDADLSALEERLATMTSAHEAEVLALEEAVEARDQALTGMRTTVERHEQDLATATEATQRYREALEEVGRRLEQSQTENEAVGSELRATITRLETRCSELEGDLAGRDSALVESQASIATFEKTVAEQQKVCADAEARAQASEAAVNDAASRIAELEARTEQDQRQLRLAGTKLAELARVVAEQAPRLERGAEAMALVGELDSEIARLREEATRATGIDVEAIRGPLDVRIMELERELQAARSQAFDPSSLDQIVSEATAPFVARITDLESALEAARRAGGEVDPEAFAALVAEARAPLEARIAELESAATSGDPALVEEAVAAATETLRAELEDARNAANGDTVARSKYEQLKEKCRRAERRSDELETALSLTNDRGQAQEMAKRLRGKAERIGEVARHLERRKARLAAVRTAMRHREVTAGPSGGTTFHELQRLEAQRRELEQVRDFLSRSEQQMVRRWARPRSVAIVAWMMVVLAISAAAGWVGGTRFVPMPGVATVSLTAAAMNGKTLDPDAAEAWQAWHTALATDPAFIALVGKRLAARGLMPAGGESALSTMLANDLGFENEGHGRLRLVLEGGDARTLEPVLDAVATTMASESARQAPRRIDGARATLPTERVTAGGLGYATLVSGPYGTDALLRMGAIAGGVLAGCTLLVLSVYGLLSRSKRVFEANADGEVDQSVA